MNYVLLTDAMPAGFVKEDLKQTSRTDLAIPF
jgi:hypothetical protein